MFFVFTIYKSYAQVKTYMKSISGQKYHMLKNTKFATYAKSIVIVAICLPTVLTQSMHAGRKHTVLTVGAGQN